jgi:hypothetical protein
MRDKKVAWQKCVDNESQRQAKKQLKINRNRFKSPRRTVQIRIQKKWHLLILKEAKEAEVTLSKYLDYVCRAYFSKS